MGPWMWLWYFDAPRLTFLREMSSIFQVCFYTVLQQYFRENQHATLPVHCYATHALCSDAIPHNFTNPQPFGSALIPALTQLTLRGTRGTALQPATSNLLLTSGHITQCLTANRLTSMLLRLSRGSTFGLLISPSDLFLRVCDL